MAKRNKNIDRISTIRMNPKVDKYLSKSNPPTIEAVKWKEEFEKLRMIILDCGLGEELKWDKPCYMFENNNILIIQAFKEYFALGFFKGFLLDDSKKILIAPGENSQTMRQIRFANAQEIVEMRPIIKAYIYEAIELERSDLKLNFKEKTKLKVPEEFQTKLDEIPTLKTAFYALTPGRQRTYILYFSGAKQSKTRELRIEKYLKQILDGEGMND